MQKYLEQMDTILSNLFARYASSITSPAILLSGGIDSSTAAYLVSRHFEQYFILSMGTEKSKDREYVDIMTSFLKHDGIWVELKKEMMESSIGSVTLLLEEAGVPVNLMQLSLAMGYYLTFRQAKESGIAHIITGQGPDILLGGYHKYKSVDRVNEEITKDMPLLETDKRRDSAMAEYFGITLHNPYLEPEFVDFARSVPEGYKINGAVEKFILREFAKAKGLPGIIVSRPKKAFQYSTGLQNMMKNLVK